MDTLKPIDQDKDVVIADVTDVTLHAENVYRDDGTGRIAISPVATATVDVKRSNEILSVGVARCDAKHARSYGYDGPEKDVWLVDGLVEVVDENNEVQGVFNVTPNNFRLILNGRVLDYAGDNGEIGFYRKMFYVQPQVK